MSPTSIASDIGIRCRRGQKRGPADRQYRAGAVAPGRSSRRARPRGVRFRSRVPSPGRSPRTGRPAACHSAIARLRSTRCGASDPTLNSPVQTVSSAMRCTTRFL
jgi:hypothetical protein